MTAPDSAYPAINGLRTALGSGTPLLGTFIKSSDVELFEITIDAGFDYVILDLQHAPLTVRDVSTYCAIARRSRSSLVVRIGPEQIDMIGQLLDVGVEAIQCGEIDRHLGEQTRRRASYPPAGERSLTQSTRAAGYGSVPLEEHLARAESDVMLIGQVETVAALESLDDLTRAGHWNALFLGPVDLELDLRARRSHQPPIEQALEDASRSILAAGVPLAIFVNTVQDALEWARAGATLLTVGSDISLFSVGRRQQVTEWSSAWKK